MTEETKGPEAPQFEQISPAKIEINTRSDSGDLSQDAQQSQQTSRNPWLTLGWAALAGLALLVFLLLPRIVEKPELVIEPEVIPKANKSSSAAASGGISPWQEAQLSRERKEAQDILAEFLDAQFALEEKRVELWAAQEFEEAKMQAQSGDQAYREQAFTQAKEDYHKGLAILKALQARADSVVTEYLQSGNVALERGDATAAQDAFSLVLQIDPLNQAAAAGFSRSETLDQVLTILGKALVAESGNDLDEALGLLNEALTIDSELTPAQESKAVVKVKIVERDFAISMSEGFATLDAGNYAGAKRAFRQALKLKPKSTEAQDGLNQVSHALTQAKISKLKLKAQELEQKENWQGAKDAYDAVLALDSSVLFAQEGMAKTDTRARLDKLLEDVIANPERLTAGEVYRETQQLLRVAETVRNPGPRLNNQINTIEARLKIVAEPITITLVSDNETDVTLYKVGHLGNFESHQLSLKPGVYAMVGKRSGYRDVRKEFRVTHGDPVDPIAIQCTEKIL